MSTPRPGPTYVYTDGDSKVHEIDNNGSAERISTPPTLKDMRTDPLSDKSDFEEGRTRTILRRRERTKKDKDGNEVKEVEVEEEIINEIDDEDNKSSMKTPEQVPLSSMLRESNRRRRMATPHPRVAIPYYSSRRRPRPLRPAEEFLTDNQPELPPSQVPVAPSSEMFDAMSDAMSETSVEIENNGDNGSLHSASVKFASDVVDIMDNEINNNYNNNNDEGQNGVQSLTNQSHQSSSLQNSTINNELEANVPGVPPLPLANANANAAANAAAAAAAAAHTHSNDPFAPIPVNVPMQTPFPASFLHPPPLLPPPPHLPFYNNYFSHQPHGMNMYYSSSNSSVMGSGAVPGYPFDKEGVEKVPFWKPTSRSLTNIKGIPLSFKGHSVHVGNDSNGKWLALVAEGEKKPAVTIEGGYMNKPATSPSKVIEYSTNNKGRQKQNTRMFMYARKGRTPHDVRIVIKKEDTEKQEMITGIIPATLNAPWWPAARPFLSTMTPAGMEGSTVSAVFVNGARVRGDNDKIIRKHTNRNSIVMRLVTSADGLREWVQTNDGEELATIAYSNMNLPPHLYPVPPFARSGYPGRLFINNNVDISVVASVLACRLWVYVLTGNGY